MFNKNYPCNLDYARRTERNGNPINAGMLFRKNWPFTKLLNFHLLIMKETGALDRLLEPYISLIKKSCPNEVKIRPIMMKPKQIAAEKICFLCVVLLAGVILALISFVVEKLSHKVTFRL